VAKKKKEKDKPRKDINPLAELKKRVAKLEKRVAALEPQTMDVKPAK
jgi:hypothetical protein